MAVLNYLSIADLLIGLVIILTNKSSLLVFILVLRVALEVEVNFLYPLQNKHIQILLYYFAVDDEQADVYRKNLCCINFLNIVDQNKEKVR